MLLDVQEVTKQFGGLVAVDRLNFQVNEGEILGVIGPNGAGKTTVMGVISGFHPATSGRIVFAGVDITGLKAHRIARLGIGRTFQASTLFMSLPVIENVFMAYHLAYRTAMWERLLRFPAAVREEAELRGRAAELLDRVGLGQVRQEITKNLPHGYQRILGVCIALATNPRLILLDEPMTGMNPAEVQTMSDLVRSIRDDGVTIVMIEHNMGAVMSVCDRIVVMNYGRKIAEGQPRDIQENEEVIEAYLGKE